MGNKLRCNLCPEQFDTDLAREQHGNTRHPQTRAALAGRLRNAGRRSIKQFRKRIAVGE